MLVRLADTWSEGWTLGGGSQGMGGGGAGFFFEKMEQDTDLFLSRIPQLSQVKILDSYIRALKAGSKGISKCRQCAKECLAGQDLGE